MADAGPRWLVNIFKYTPRAHRRMSQFAQPAGQTYSDLGAWHPGTGRVLKKPELVLGSEPWAWIRACLLEVLSPWCAMIRLQACCRSRGMGSVAGLGSQEPCVVSACPQPAQPSSWACLQSPSVPMPHAPRPSAGVPLCYPNGTRSPDFMT